jgi:hypothetical protein
VQRDDRPLPFRTLEKRATPRCADGISVRVKQRGTRGRELPARHSRTVTTAGTQGAASLAGSAPSGKLLRMPRAKTFSIKIADLPNMVDAIFAGDHDDPGWVEMNANDRGRACVNALFPEARIAWREPGNGAPADWHGFVINIPDVVPEMESALARWNCNSWRSAPM